MANTQIPTSMNRLTRTEDLQSGDYSMSSASFLKATRFSQPTLNTAPKIPVERLMANAGTDVRLNCSENPMSIEGPVAWVRKSAKDTHSSGMPPPFPTNPEDGSIMLSNLKPKQDDGIYTCTIANRKMKIVQLSVKSKPLAVANLNVIPHSVYALVTWKIPIDGDGGYPILRYELLIRLQKSHLLISDNNSSWSNDNYEGLEGNPAQIYIGTNPSAVISQEEYEWTGNQACYSKICLMLLQFSNIITLSFVPTTIFHKPLYITSCGF